MPKKRTPSGRGLTANQAVAFNLALARRERGWTQEEAAEQLEEHLGQRWSKANWSAAERSFLPDSRGRGFTADEIVAFAKTFGRPVAWWFLPPEDFTTEEAVALLMAQIAQTPELQESYVARLRDLYAHLGITELPRSIVFQRALEEAFDANAARDLVDFKNTLADLTKAIDNLLEKGEGL